MREIHYVSFLLVVILTLSLVVGFLQLSEPSFRYDQKDKSDTEYVISQVPHDYIRIVNDSDFETQGWPGEGTKADPYLIEDLSFTSTRAIEIMFTRVYFEINDCIMQGDFFAEGIYFYNVSHGAIQNCILKEYNDAIRILESSDCRLTNNEVTKNTNDGIDLSSCNDCNLTDNTSTDNIGYGVDIQYSIDCIIRNNAADNSSSGYHVYESSNCILQSNTASENTEHDPNADPEFNCGFCLYSSDYCSLIDNNAFNNSEIGFYLKSSHYSVLENNIAEHQDEEYYLLACNYCNITDNTAKWAKTRGFSLLNCGNCTLVRNTAYANGWSGLHLSGSEFCTLFLNRLGFNAIYVEDGANAYDLDGSSNSWDNGTHGNHYSDYNGTGWYWIPGSTGSIDHYPFSIINNPPTIDHPNDIEYVEGSINSNITWNTYDWDIVSFEVYRNGSIVEEVDDWGGGTLVVFVDELSIGIYNYTVIIFDSGDNFVSDTVIVTIISNTTTTTTDGIESLYLIIGGAAVVGVVAIVILLFRRRE